MLVDPDRAAVDLPSHRQGAIEIGAPYAPCEPELGIIGSRDHFVDRAVFQHGEHRSELLLADQRGTVIKIPHDGWRNEIARTVGYRAAGDDLATLACILDQRLDPLELHLVLD